MDNQIIKDFVSQLLNSRSMVGLSPIQKEENVVIFLTANRDKLLRTVFSSENFPINDWSMIQREILKELGVQIVELLQPKLEYIIKGLRLEWKDRFDNFYADPDDFKSQIKKLAEKLILRSKARQNFGHIADFIENNAFFPYLSSIYENRRYVYNGLTRFDDVNFETPELALDFLYTSILILPLFDINLPLKVIIPQYKGPDSKTISLQDTENNSILKNTFLHRIKEILLKEFPGMGPLYLEWLIKTSYNAEESDKVAFMSKMMKIVYHFAISYKKSVRERGAESFDASWFNIARVNHKFYTYDYSILDECYKITIEEDL